MESRITRLEEKLSFAEYQFDELNKTVYRQQLEIDRLQQEVRRLRQQVQANMPSDGHSLRDEIPPHY